MTFASSEGPMALRVAFDLLVNALGSFGVGALFAALACAVLRPGPGRRAQLLWAIPFAKVVVDAAHGIPEDAFFWARATGVPHSQGSLRLGFGVAHFFVPEVQVGLAAATQRGALESTWADYAAMFCKKHGAPWAPALLAALVLGVGVALVARRLLRLVAGERSRARLRGHATLLDVRRLGRARREVEVFLSTEHEGAPFTGGLLRPYVCFPARTFAALSPAEREAALAHELGHVAGHDLALFTALGVLRDILWFVPGAGAVARRIEASAEHLADRAAVRSGASALDLASALVRTATLLVAGKAQATPALAGRGSQLARRVRALTAGAHRASRSRQIAGALACAWVIAAALSSTFAGH